MREMNDVKKLISQAPFLKGSHKNFTTSLGLWVLITTSSPLLVGSTVGKSLAWVLLYFYSPHSATPL